MNKPHTQLDDLTSSCHPAKLLTSSHYTCPVIAEIERASKWINLEEMERLSTGNTDDLINDDGEDLIEEELKFEDPNNTETWSWNHAGSFGCDVSPNPEHEADRDQEDGDEDAA